MRSLVDQEQWPKVAEFMLCPINSPAVLIYWRPLSFLLNQLGGDKQEEFLSLPMDGGTTGKGVDII